MAWDEGAKMTTGKHDRRESNAKGLKSRTGLNLSTIHTLTPGQYS